MTSSPIESRRRRVTAAEVAARAGTSVATVSLVVNGKTAGRVSAANVERVQQAIADLGYVVDHTARTLVRGTSNIVVLIAPDLSNPFYGRVISGIQDELGDDFQLLLSVTGEGRIPSSDDVHRLIALRPAGLLVEAPDDAFLRGLPHGVRLVLLDAPGRETEASTVNFDLEGGVTALLDHLHELGHTNLGYLDSVTRTETFGLRRSLILRGAEQRGMHVIPADGAESVIDPSAAAAATLRAWPTWQRRGVTAVLAATDSHAYGVLAAARDLGLRVPEDLAVTGFDNLPTSAIVAPGLTTVELSGDALGRHAARSLRAQLSKDADATRAPVLAPLVIRASTVAPGSASR